MYNCIIEKEEESYAFGMRIPKNLFIVGTANIDKFSEPFSGKVLDRMDVIRMQDMRHATDTGDMLRSISENWFTRASDMTDPAFQEFI